MAFTIMTSAKKGISALQVQRQLGIGSYRTAWFLCHRIREAKKREPLAGLLSGTVEVDETYVGGKARPQAGASKAHAKRGRGTKKTPVVALVERGGRVRARKIDRVDAATLKGAIRENVDRKAQIMTDEFRFVSRPQQRVCGPCGRAPLGWRICARRRSHEHGRKLLCLAETRRDGLIPPRQQTAP